MTNANVVTLRPRLNKPVAKPAQSRAVMAKVRRQRYSATVVLSVALVLTALSLQHLAHGVAMVTAASETEAWLMAIGIDAGFISLELAMLFSATDTVRRRIEKYANKAIIGTLAASAGFNGFAFCAKVAAEALWYVYAAPIGLGVAIPAMIYVLVRIGSVLYLTSVPQRG